MAFPMAFAPEQAPVGVEYELTRDDLYAFQWRAAFHSARGRRVRRTSYIIWIVVILLFAVVPAIGPHGVTLSRIDVTSILIFLPLAFLFQWCFERMLLRHAIRQLLKDERPDRGQLGWHRLVLTEEGLTESTAVGESRTTWAGVHRVEQNRDYIYIYTAPALAHVVPKRAFASPEQAERFYQLSQARRLAR